MTYQSLPEGVDPTTALDPGQYLFYSLPRGFRVCKEDKADGLAQPCGLYSLTDICIMGADQFWIYIILFICTNEPVEIPLSIQQKTVCH